MESAIKSNVPEKKIHAPGLNNLPNNKNINQLSNTELIEFRQSDIKILADHSMFGINQKAKLGLPNPFLFVLFREPIERIISHYNFFYFKQGYSNCKGVTINELPTQKLESILQELSELQVRYLTGIAKNTGSNVTEATYEQAISNLDKHYACFGVLAKLGESLEMLRKFSPDWLKFEDNFPVVNKNPLNKKLKTDSKVIDQIKFYNRLDLKLYEHVKKQFDLKYKALVNS